MTKVTGIVVLFAVLFACNKPLKEDKNVVTQIIPEPQEMLVFDQGFKFTEKTTIDADDKLAFAAQQLYDYLSPPTGSPFPINEKKFGGNSIELKIDSELVSLGDEGYQIKSDAKKILISAYNKTGIFYGIQSLRQLLPAEIENRTAPKENQAWEIPCVSITDFPRFKWRGLMLDCSRTFSDKEYH